jgi:Flp pilus assembly protein TadG
MSFIREEDGAYSIIISVLLPFLIAAIFGSVFITRQVIEIFDIQRIADRTAFYGAIQCSNDPSLFDEADVRAYAELIGLKDATNDTIKIDCTNDNRTSVTIDRKIDSSVTQLARTLLNGSLKDTVTANATAGRVPLGSTRTCLMLNSQGEIDVVMTGFASITLSNCVFGSSGEAIDFCFSKNNCFDYDDLILMKGSQTFKALCPTLAQDNFDFLSNRCPQFDDIVTTMDFDSAGVKSFLDTASFEEVAFCDDSAQGNNGSGNSGKDNSNGKGNTGNSNTQEDSGPLYLQSGIYKIVDNCTLSRSIIATDQAEILIFLDNGADLIIPSNLSIDLKPYAYDGLKLAFFALGASEITSTGNSTVSAPGIWYLPSTNFELTGTVSANFELDCAQLYLNRFSLIGTVDMTMACPDNVTTGGDNFTSSNLVFLTQ